MLQEQVRRGATVIVTTHILEVAERLADRIGIIRSRPADGRGHARRAARAGRSNESTLEEVFLDLTARTDDAGG